MRAAAWKPQSFCTILDTEGHQMGMKYSMEGFIKYFKLNTVGNSKLDGLQIKMHAVEVSYYGRLSQSRMTTSRINTVHVSQGMIKLMYI